MNAFDYEYNDGDRQFVNTIRAFENHNEKGQLDNFISERIKEYSAHRFVQLIRLSEKELIVKELCYKDDLVEFWDNMLLDQGTYQTLKINDLFMSPLRLQPAIHSFDLIKAAFFFAEADQLINQLPLDNEESLSLFGDILLQAVDCGSSRAGRLLLECIINNYYSFDFNELEAMFIQLAQRNKSPGYLLLSKFYDHFEDFEKGLNSVISAEALLPESDNEIHNAGYSVEQINHRLVSLKSYFEGRLNFKEQQVNKAPEEPGDHWQLKF